MIDYEKTVYSTNDALDEAILDVSAGRQERVATPGLWRVYRSETGSLVIEIFKRDET